MRPAGSSGRMAWLAAERLLDKSTVTMTPGNRRLINKEANVACQEELRAFEPDAEGRRVFELQRPVRAMDTCWSTSHSVQLNAGDILVTHDRESDHRGNVIFIVNGEKKVILPSFVLSTRYPGDLGLFDPQYLIGADPAMSATDPRLAELDALGRRKSIPQVEVKPAKGPSFGV